MMLSCALAEGPRPEAPEPVAAGGSFQWVLCNDGTVPWPEATTLRLVAGHVLAQPVVEVPAAAPGGTVVVELETEAVDTPVEACYVLVTPDGQPFGELLTVKVAPAEPEQKEAPEPLLAVAGAPLDGREDGIDALQGEVKTAEWMLANVGQVSWPKDVSASLIYNTPGFAHLPESIEVPAIEPGMTVFVDIEALMPEREGVWKAMWAVTSPTHPEFGDILYVEFKVCEFPFLDWALAAAAGEEQGARGEAPPRALSMAVAAHAHLVPGGGQVEYPDDDQKDLVSLGRVSGLPPGCPWVLELALANDGREAWPEDAALVCVLGGGLGSEVVPIGRVPAGEAVHVPMELVAPASPAACGWSLVCGEEAGSLGPALLLSVQ